MIEHAPWIGEQYATDGFDRQRLAIAGYSAWTADDHEGYTIESMHHVVAGRWPRARFYHDIAEAFGSRSADFYPRVMLFEFVPGSVGGADQKYAVATEAQNEHGRERLLRLTREFAPDKLVVFSSKGWRALQPLIAAEGAPILPLGDTGFSYAELRSSAPGVKLIGLRHPQYASKQSMTQACAAALQL